MKILNLFVKLVSSMQFLAWSLPFSSQQTQDVFVSQRRGHDTPTCGAKPSSPCKTIALGVWHAAQHAKVYIDGTGSEATPYTCKSPSLTVPGIYSNKSLMIIGELSIVFVKCQEESGIKFDRSNHVETSVTLTNIKFINTSLEANDVSLDIDRCVFTDVQQAINIQSTSNLIVSFGSSLCENISTCMSITIAKLVQPINVTIKMVNSNIVGNYSSLNQASGLDVTSAWEYKPGEIVCDIILKNVVFKHNNVGNGLIFVNLTNTFTSLSLDEVVFWENKNRIINIISLISIQGSFNHHLIINNTEFHSNYKNMYSAIMVNTKNTSTLSITNSTFNSFDLGFVHPGVVQVSGKVCIVSLDYTKCIGTDGSKGGAGGCLSIIGQTATVVIQNSLFRNNQATCAAVLWLKIEGRALLKIHHSLFVSNTGRDGGGLGVIDSKEGIVEITDSTVDQSLASGPGGVFIIGLFGTRCVRYPDPRSIVSLTMRSVKVFNSESIQNGGGVMALYANRVNIVIHDSTIYNVSSDSSGAFCASYSSLQHIEIVNTTLSKIQSSGEREGVVLSTNGVQNLTVQSVTIDNVQSKGTDSAFFLLLPDEEGSIIINNTSIKHYNGKGSIFLIMQRSKRKFSISITNSVFESYQSFAGACLSISTELSNVMLHNVTFKHCHTYAGQGGAISLSGSGGNMSIQSCYFIDNGSLKEKGGAIAIYLSTKDTIIDPGCVLSSQHSFNTTVKDSPPHRTWKYNFVMTVKDSKFINNTALNGGALSLSRGSHIIESCSFIDNFAGYQGGHIFVTSDSTSLKVINSNFTQKHSTLTVLDVEDNQGVAKYGLGYGIFISSQSYGPLVILNSTLESNTSTNSESQTVVSITSGNYIIFNNFTKIKCLIGSQLSVLNIPYSINAEYQTRLECLLTLDVVQFTCKPCSIDTYSLQHGHSSGMNVVSSFKCSTCPFGAECNNHVSAKPNFWGFEVQRNPKELNFTLCPLGYCKQPDKQDLLDYNSCQGNRTGALCGRCRENYSETLLSTSCCHDNQCNDSWILGVAVVMVMLMALYLIYKPHISHMLIRQILWFRSAGTEDEQNPSQNGQSSSDGENGHGGYLKIVFYFYQVAKLLVVSTSYPTVVEKYIVQPVMGLFNFQYHVSSSNGFLCPFPGLNAVSKQLLLTTYVFGVLFMIVLIYYCHYLLHKCKSKPTPNKGPYLAATLETLLLGYMVFATTSLGLLSCTPLGDESRLFISGDVVCYQWWQYILMVFVGVIVFPFIISLALGSLWLYNDTVSVKEFLLGCVLPLPYLLYKLFVYLCKVGKPHNKSHNTPHNKPQNEQQHKIDHETTPLLGEQQQPCYDQQSEVQYENSHKPETSQTPEYVQQNQLQHGPRRESQRTWQHDLLNTVEDQLHHDPKAVPSHGHGQGPGSKPSVTKVLYGPFHASSIYWESILISRRLLIVLIHVLVNDPLFKELLLVLACVIILAHHIIVKPFKDPVANNIESMSLLTLVVIATINSFKASFVSIGQAPKGPLKTLAHGFDTVQVVILMILPAICVLAVIAAIVSQIVRLVIKTYRFFIRSKLSQDYDIIDSDAIQKLEQPCENNDNKT